MDKSGPRREQITKFCEVSLGILGPQAGATRKADRSIENKNQNMLKEANKHQHVSCPDNTLGGTHASCQAEPYTLLPAVAA